MKIKECNYWSDKTYAAKKLWPKIEPNVTTTWATTKSLLMTLTEHLKSIKVTLRYSTNKESHTSHSRSTKSVSWQWRQPWTTSHLSPLNLTSTTIWDLLTVVCRNLRSLSSHSKSVSRTSPQIWDISMREQRHIKWLMWTSIKKIYFTPKCC